MALPPAMSADTRAAFEKAAEICSTQADAARAAREHGVELGALRCWQDIVAMIDAPGGAAPGNAPTSAPDFARTLIDQLGGTLAVARMFEIAAPSVTAWKTEGLPPARLKHLRDLAAYRPDIAAALAAAAGVPANAPTSPGRAAVAGEAQEVA